ncbi:hypothetical protein [Lysinibacillus sp. ZYM-1]|uniref:hypothetical protein n=1 Tax=Lysinibacillus sp. ZYM-1 TaxID=1681184 RepID=UPI000A956EF3|nr:hypothetical protein [Lysinibacillus sp. ZYM-1]
MKYSVFLSDQGKTYEDKVENVRTLDSNDHSYVMYDSKNNILYIAPIAKVVSITKVD